MNVSCQRREPFGDVGERQVVRTDEPDGPPRDEPIDYAVRALGPVALAWGLSIVVMVFERDDVYVFRRG